MPTGGASGNPVDPDKVRTLSIDRNEVIQLDGQTVPPDQLAARLETLRAERPDVAVVIRPHKELTVQKLVGVMDSLRAAKIANVGIVTEQSGGVAPP